MTKTSLSGDHTFETQANWNTFDVYTSTTHLSQCDADFDTWIRNNDANI